MARHQIRHKHVKQCIFCTNPASTKEHAWEDWAVQLLQQGPSAISGHQEGDELFVRYQKAVRIMCLCENCNIIWLKNLGEQAMPFIRAMSADIGIALDTPQQHVMAIWATSRAMVWEYMKDPIRPRPDFYYEVQRRLFRHDYSIPSNTFVWLARHAGTETVGAWVSDYTKPSRCHVTTLLYGYLLVQILSVRPNPSDPSPVDFKPNNTVVPWSLAHSMIRPTQRTIIWPPRFTVGTNVPLADFLSRWDKHPPGELIAL